MKLGFTQREVDYIAEQARFDSDQQRVFDMLIDRRYGVTWTDITIYTMIGITEYKYYKIKKEIKKKIQRILKDYPPILH